MRRKDLYVLVVTAVVVALLLVGFFVINGGWPTAGNVAPDYHALEEEAPEDVQRPVPSETGDIHQP
ncbi:hypothetical protein [Chelativorans salis]|uniref:Uncharacterized protein n=1 Tax=Chelativorans salis TaxID=2978478 RepID=A0ABT2LS99_9HYPH|nr:hypothetical protein [Chelativorans sp. EGI FJ00035]MCT7377406.1 hypothetical protein [Chelativorans sp. EGI FJ00035]